MIDVVEITINEFKENIYDKYIKLLNFLPDTGRIGEA